MTPWLLAGCAVILLAVGVGEHVRQGRASVEASAATVAASGADSWPTMPIVLDERFGDRRSGWPHNPGGATWFSDSALHGAGYELMVRHPGHFVALEAPIAATFRDTVVTARFRKVAGPPGGTYGIILRSSGPASLDGSSQSGHFYLFEASDLGDFQVRLRDGDRWTSLTSPARSPAVGTGTSYNELVARVIGDRLTFLINGEEVADLRDATIGEGAAGIFAGGDANHVSIHRFTVVAPSLRLRGPE